MSNTEQVNVKDNNDCHVYENVILSKNVIRECQSAKTFFS